jgi:predicted 3-demethylubiquinone-9 3-methyltransferase (glyoxalase superfamily)
LARVRAAEVACLCQYFSRRTIPKINKGPLTGTPGPRFKSNKAVSFFISVETQEKADYFWTRLSAGGGATSQCGWLKDKFGLSWQVVPAALGRYLSDPDRKKADRVMQAMMKMQKIVIADLDKAYAG